MSQYNRKMGGVNLCIQGVWKVRGEGARGGGKEEGERGRRKGNGRKKGRGGRRKGNGRKKGRGEGGREMGGRRGEGKEEDKLTNVYQRSFPFPRIL